MRVVDVNLDMRGQISRYPFDSYSSGFAITVVHAGGNPGDVAARVPTVVRMGSYIGGWDVTTQPVADTDQYVPVFTVDIRRDVPTVFFTIFVMVLMWALALAGVAMAIMLVHLHRPIDAGPLTYLAALLFAFPLIRTEALPGGPALGTLTDYTAFFWAEVIVAVTLIYLLVTWIIREGRSKGQAEPEEHETPAGWVAP